MVPGSSIHWPDAHSVDGMAEFSQSKTPLMSIVPRLTALSIR
jgi:hypothetical protein